MILDTYEQSYDIAFGWSHGRIDMVIRERYPIDGVDRVR